MGMAQKHSSNKTLKSLLFLEMDAVLMIFSSLFLSKYHLSCRFGKVENNKMMLN